MPNLDLTPIEARLAAATPIINNRATKGKYVHAGTKDFVDNYVFTEGPRPGVLESHVCDLLDESVEGMAVLQRGWGEAQHTPDPEDFMERNMAYLLLCLNDYPKAMADIRALLDEVRELREALVDAHAMVKEAYKDGALNMYCKTTPPKMGVVSKTIEADWLASDARKRLEGGGP